ncbi:Uncharacterised protein [Vibrio cholerae]|nr:Uncharacterised protein [Vibrio cholerae]
MVWWPKASMNLSTLPIKLYCVNASCVNRLNVGKATIAPLPNKTR